MSGRGRRGIRAAGYASVLACLGLSAPSHGSPSPSAPARPGTLDFRGVFQDSAFAPSPVRLEVLETGDTLTVAPGKSFRLTLPRDTLWNLCFEGEPAEPDSAAADTLPAAGPEAAAPSAMAAPGAGSATTGNPAAAADTASLAAGTTETSAGTEGAEAARIEKCFELVYRGRERAFSARVGEGPAVLVLEPQEAPAETPVVAAADTAQEEESSGAFRPEDAVQLKKVLVRAQRAPKRSLGKSTVSAKLIKRMPGLAEADVIRSIQGLPGVVSSSDFSTKIYVRGGGSDQNLILFDNAVVYSPVHFFGLFSTFLVEGIDEVNFYKGGFAPEYGNRLSSVLDIRSRAGGKDTADSWIKGSSVKISTFASQAHTEGRRGDLRWLAAGRGTYIKQVLDLLRRAGATDLDLDYFFYDLQGNLQYGKPGDRSMISFYNGRDKLDFTPFVVEWGNTVIPFNHERRLGRDFISRTALGYSHFSQSFGLENIFKFYNRIVTAGLKQTFEYAGLESHRLSFGVDANWMETIFINEQTIVNLRLRDDTRFMLTSLFAQDKWTLGDAEATLGARVTHSTALDEPGFEPRLSLKYRLPAGQSLDFHAGYYLQYVNSIQFGDEENLNEFYYPAKKVTRRTMNPSSSLLFSAGWAMEKFRGQWDLSVEAYYKTLDHLTIFAPSEVPDSVSFDASSDLGDLFKEAEGYSTGIELSLRRPEGILFGGVSYSSGLSVIREDNDPVAYFPKWHQPHSFKADLGINWTGTKDALEIVRGGDFYLRSSTQVKFATGLPFTEFVGHVPSHLLDQSPGPGGGGPNPQFDGNTNVIRGNRNGSLVPPYFRWDAKLLDVGREGKWNFSWTVLNLTNHENIFFYAYDRQKNPPELIKITQFPFFPMLVNYEYYF